MRQDILDEIIEGEPRYNVSDNPDGTKKIELANDVIERGTPINRELFMKLFEMHSYEVLNYIGQEFEGVPTTADVIYSQLDSATSMSNKWVGHSEGKVDINKWDFYIEGEEQPLQLGDFNSNTDRTMVGIRLPSGVVYTLAGLNQVLDNTNYVDKNIIYFYSMAKHNINFVWDLKQACKPNFHYGWNYDSSLGTYPRMNFYGSNNGSSWTTIGTMSYSDEDINTITPTTAYRYYKAQLYMNPKVEGSSYSQASIRNMYFTNVADTIESYKNKFTSENDFTISNCANVTAPSGIPNANKISSSVINGIPCEVGVTSDEFHKIRYNGGKLFKDTMLKTVTGSFVTSNSLQEFSLGFEPDLVIIYLDDNNSDGISGVNNSASKTNIPRILTKARFRKDLGQIISDGFTFKGTGNIAYKAYYIAIKF